MNICLPRNAEEQRYMVGRILRGIGGEEYNNGGHAAFSALFLDDINAPIAGVIFYGKSEHNVFVTLKIYQPGKITRQKINQTMSYAFESPLTVYRITALVSSTNRRIITLLEKLGWHKEGECIGFNGSEDDVTYIYRYTQKDWYGSKFYERDES